MRKVIALFFLPILLSSAEHFVPIGTSGNRLLLTVQNLSPFTFRPSFVRIVSSWARRTNWQFID